MTLLIPLDELAQAVLMRRTWQGLTSRGLATEIGVSPSTITRVEQGKAPAADVYRRLCLWLAEPAGEFHPRKPPVVRLAPSTAPEATMPDATDALVEALADRGVTVTFHDGPLPQRVIDAEREAGPASEDVQRLARIFQVAFEYDSTGVDAVWLEHTSGVLASDWLRERDAKITRDAKVAALREVQQRLYGDDGSDFAWSCVVEVRERIERGEL